MRVPFFFPLFSPDDPQGGGTPAAPAPTSPAGGDDGGDDGGDTGGGDRVFTNEEVGKLLAAERKKVRAAALKERSTKTETKPKAKPDTGDGVSDADRMERMLDFRDVAGDYGLNRKQRRRLEREFLASGDSDVDSWLEAAVADYGLVKTPDKGSDSGPDAKTTPTTPATPSGPPASDRGGPAAPPDAAAMENPLRWNEDHVRNIIAGAKSHAEGVQEVRRKFMAGLSNVQVAFPRGPK